MVGFQLGQGNEDVRRDDRLSDEQVIQLRQAAEVKQLNLLVVIEIDQGDVVMAKDVAQAAGADQMLDITAMTGPLGDDNLRGSFAPAQFNGGGDHMRMRVD